MPWVDDETGEASETCPNCYVLEREARLYRAKITRLENDAERQMVARRDGAAWKEFLRCYQLAFPEKRLTATGIKSATASKFFVRLEAGATLEQTLDAIRGAWSYQYVVFGKRVRSGSKSDHSIHPQDIVSVNNDALFDFLVSAGAELRAARGSA